ncbi:unnamed protein product, partial [Owenia fusiformis]
INWKNTGWSISSRNESGISTFITLFSMKIHQKVSKCVPYDLLKSEVYWIKIVVSVVAIVTACVLQRGTAASSPDAFLVSSDPFRFKYFPKSTLGHPFDLNISRSNDFIVIVKTSSFQSSLHVSKEIKITRGKIRGIRGMWEQFKA